ncbi:MAG: hypothetical protein PHD81_00480 [Candidatus Nanoarchaeia archaeon]|nr:hypothetical protein [Candidatus Nanoarchaeia archaeon]MDD5587565.1 hypothetical protein [Candidatus Nanoarchaeia archaeon]
MQPSVKHKKQEIRYFLDKVNLARAKELAEENKEKAFGMFHGIARKFGRQEEIKVVGMLKRYYPFWHINAFSYIEYERKNKYKVEVEKEVKTFVVDSERFDVEKGEKRNALVINGTDICEVKKDRDLLIDATLEHKKPEDLKNNTKFEKYLNFETRKIKEIEDLIANESTQVYAIETKAEFIVRSILQAIMHPVDADKVLNEEISVEKLILYFHPIYIFECIAYPQGGKRFIFVDGLTEEVSSSSKLENKKTETSFAESEILEIGGEALSSFIPGGQAAYTVFKRLKEKRRKDKFRA